MRGSQISRLLTGALSLAIVAGCQSIPDDYPLTQGFQSRLSKLQSRLLDPEIPASAARRLRALGNAGGLFAIDETRALSRLPRVLARGFDMEMGRIEDSGRNLGDLVTAGLAGSGRRLSRLASYPRKAAANLNLRLRNLRSIRHRLLRSREFLTMPGAQSRQTGAEGQRAGFWQRIFARIRP